MPKVLKREAAKRDLIQRWVGYAENAAVEVAAVEVSRICGRISVRHGDVGLNLPELVELFE